MSSFDPLRPAETPPQPFAALAPSPAERRLRVRANVFPAFDAACDEPPPPETAPRDPGAGAPERDAAYAAGFAAGRAAALEEGVAGAAEFAAAIEELARFRSGLRDRYQQELLELALGIARKVVQRELAEHPEHWLEMLREAIRLAIDRESIRIRVGPVLHHFLLEHFAELRARLDEVKELELIDDASLGSTGCVIESHYGELDLGIDGQIGAIRATLMGPE